MSVQIIHSHGNGIGGKRYSFIRPSGECFNKSRRVENIGGKIQACIEKWFTPMNYYLIDGHKIGSNSPENALKEYWRVCEISDVGVMFEVLPISTPNVPVSDTTGDASSNDAGNQINHQS